MRDVLPDEVELRDTASHAIVDVYRSYGFRRIETPALESLRLLLGSEGGENEKLIFKVLKRGDDLEQALAGSGGDLADLGLRFDLTVPLARYYAENHARLPDPLKAIQIGPVWRAERPQKGRYRQFTQCDIDVVGVGGIVAEVELILATCEALARLGLTGLTVRVNDRRILALIAGHCGFGPERQASFFIAFDKLDKIGREGVVGELREAGHEAAAVARFETLLPTLLDEEMSLTSLERALAPAPEAAAFRSLAAILAIVTPELPAGARATLDSTLVRGMGYYTGTIFEIVSPAFPASIAGGGRYDRMVGRLLGRDVPACGFSIGFERLVAILGERGARHQATARPAAARGRRIALLVDDDTELPRALHAARALREQGDLVSLELRRKNTRKQLDELQMHGFSDYGVVEAGKSSATVKPLRQAG